MVKSLSRPGDDTPESTERDIGRNGEVNMHVAQAGAHPNFFQSVDASTEALGEAVSIETVQPVQPSGSVRSIDASPEPDSFRATSVDTGLRGAHVKIGDNETIVSSFDTGVRGGRDPVITRPAQRTEQKKKASGAQGPWVAPKRTVEAADLFRSNEPDTASGNLIQNFLKLRGKYHSVLSTLQTREPLVAPKLPSEPERDKKTETSVEKKSEEGPKEAVEEVVEKPKEKKKKAA